MHPHSASIRVQIPKARVTPEIREVCCARGLCSKDETQQNQPPQSGNFHQRENILNNRTSSNATCIDPGEKKQRSNRQQILRIEADVEWTQGAKPNVVGPENVQMPY